MANPTMQITLSPQQETYAPGTEVTAQISITSSEGTWECDKMELIMFWRTSGIGTKDEGIAYREQLCGKNTQIPSHFSRDVRLTMPLHPYTYNGKLIKITWYIGLYLKKGWMNNPEIEVPVIITPPERIATLAGESNGVDLSKEIYYDESGKPVKR